MDTSEHSLENLFIQLGMDGSSEVIEEFVKKHKLGRNESLDEAAFWTPSQAQFIRDCWLDDSDWAEVVDRLDAMLHS